MENNIGYSSRKSNTKWVIIAIVAIVVLYVIGTQRSLATSTQKINKEKATVAANLTARADKIGNLVETVKGYTTHEEKCIQEITEARKMMSDAKKNNDYAVMEEAYDIIDKNTRDLFVIIESNPELKAEELFIRLMDEIAGSENRITIARENYNIAVESYNRKVSIFPSSLVASLLGYEEMDMYEAPSEHYEAPKVNFD